MTVSGIDVASYQTTTYSTAGLAFVFAKATEGTSYVNPHYSGQVAHGRAAGLVVGHYHFADGGDAVAEAKHFLATVQLKRGDLIAYDWEDTRASQAERDAWIAYVRQHAPGYRIVLYCNLSFWKSRDTENNAADGLWIADPDAPAGHPRVTHAWVFHQYSETGGIDHNVASFATVAALRAWAGVAVPKPPIKPPTTPAKPPAAKPHVSLAHIIHAARTDPHAKQGHTTYAAEVRIVEAALRAEGLISAKYASDGSFGSLTVKGYGKWQAKLHYTGTAANGIPGHDSLVKLGAKHGFTVGA